MVKGTLFALGNQPKRHVFVASIVNDLVIHVSDVADKGDHIVVVFKPATQNVKAQTTTNVTYVWRSLDCCATQVNTHATGGDGFKVAHRAR